MSTRANKVNPLLVWFAGNSVAANLLMLGMAGIGLITVMTMKTEIYPTIDPRLINVVVSYNGASPKDIESGINRRIEDAVRGVEGVKRISSSAREGVGTVAVEMSAQANTDQVLSDVRNVIDRLQDFPPEGAQEPIVTKVSITPEVLTLAVSGDASERELRLSAERIKRGLLSSSVLTEVTLDGVRDYEIAIEISEEALRRYGLSFQTISERIASSSLDLAGGTVRTSNGEILLRLSSKRETPDEFAQIPLLTQQNGTIVTLGDIALIRDGFADAELQALFNGKPAAFVRVARSATQGAITIEDAVQKYLESLSLPAHLRVDIANNETDALRDRVNLMARNALQGLALVFLVLVLFLDLKLAFWTCVAIPVSFLGGLAIASLFGVTLNMVSLFALIIVLGIVVDDAVVVGESIFHEQTLHTESHEAAITGLSRVASPVALGVVTTIVAFAPMALATGTLTEVIKIVPIIVISILLVSLIESFCVLPSHLASPRRWSTGPLLWVQLKFSGALDWITRRVVEPAVRWAVRLRYATLTLMGVITFLSINAFTTGLLSFVFLPPIESDTVTVNIANPVGTPFHATQRVTEHALAASQRINEDHIQTHGKSAIRQVLTTVGLVSVEDEANSSGSNLGKITIELVPSNDRAMSSLEFENSWREALRDIPEADGLSFESGLFSLGADIEYQLSHEDDATLSAAVDRFKELLREWPGVYDVESDLQFGKRELEFSLTEHGSALGLTNTDLARQIRRAFYGEEVQRLQRNEYDVPVIVRYPINDRQSLADVYGLTIRLPTGVEIPMSSVATISESRGFSTIERTDGKRVVTVSAKVDAAVVTPDAVTEELQGVQLPGLTSQYEGLVWAEAGASGDQSSDLANLGAAMGIGMMVIFAMLASFGRSYLMPIIVLSTAIYGFVGALIGHILLGYSLSFLSIFGIVALTGVVINGSILLLDDYGHRLSQHDKNSVDAIVASVGRRFRPIMMTALTTSLGLMPMILETSTQAAFLIPMAISLGFGLLIATPMLLVAVPALLIVIEDIRALAKRRRSDQRPINVAL